MLGGIALRNLKRRKSRTLLTLTGVLLGVGLIAGLNLVIDSIEELMYERIMGSKSDIILEGNQEEGYSEWFSASDYAALESLDGIELYPIHRGDGEAKTADESTWCRFYGVNSTKYPIKTLDHGEKTLGKYEVVIDQSLQNELECEVGDNITLEIHDVEVNYTVVGVCFYMDVGAMENEIAVLDVKHFWDIKSDIINSEGNNPQATEFNSIYIHTGNESKKAEILNVIYNQSFNDSLVKDYLNVDDVATNWSRVEIHLPDWWTGDWSDNWFSYEEANLNLLESYIASREVFIRWQEWSTFSNNSLQFYDEENLRGSIWGANFTYETVLLENGTIINNSLGPNGILISSDIANATNLNKSDQIYLKNRKDEPFTIVGIISTNTSHPNYTYFGWTWDDKVIISLEAARSMSSGGWWSDWSGIGKFNILAIHLTDAPTDDIDAYKSEANEMEDTVNQTLVSALGINRFTVEAVKSQALNQFNDMLLMFRLMFLAFAMMGIIVGVILVYNVMSMAVEERTYEIGVMRANGFQKGQVKNIIFIETLFIGIIGTFLAFFLGEALYNFLQNFFAGLFSGTGGDTPFSESSGYGFVMPSMMTIAFTVVCGIILTLIAAWLPARRAAKVEPVVALHGHQVRHSGHVKANIKTLIIGIVFIVIFWALGEFGPDAITNADNGPPPLMLFMFLPIIGICLIFASTLVLFAKILSNGLAPIFGKGNKMVYRNIASDRGTYNKTFIMASFGLIFVLGIFITMDTMDNAALDQARYQDGADLVIDGADWDDIFSTSDLDAVRNTEGVSDATGVLRGDLGEGYDWDSGSRKLNESGQPTILRTTFLKSDGRDEEAWMGRFIGINATEYFNVTYGFSVYDQTQDETMDKFAEDNTVFLPENLADYYKVDEGDTLTLSTYWKENYAYYMNMSWDMYAYRKYDEINFENSFYLPNSDKEFNLSNFKEEYSEFYDTPSFNDTFDIFLRWFSPSGIEDSIDRTGDFYNQSGYPSWGPSYNLYGITNQEIVFDNLSNSAKLDRGEVILTESVANELSLYVGQNLSWKPNNTEETYYNFTVKMIIPDSEGDEEYFGPTRRTNDEFGGDWFSSYVIMNIEDVWEYQVMKTNNSVRNRTFNEICFKFKDTPTNKNDYSSSISSYNSKLFDNDPFKEGYWYRSTNNPFNETHDGSGENIVKGVYNLKVGGIIEYIGGYRWEMGSESFDNHQTLIVSSIETALKVMTYSDRPDYVYNYYDRIGNENLNETHYISNIMVRIDNVSLSDFSNLQDTKDRILAANSNMDDESNVQDTVEETKQMTVIFKGIFGLFGGFAMIIGVIGTATTLVMSTTKRQKEIGVMRALGMTQGEIRRMFLGEAIVLGLLAVTSGLVGGFVFVTMMNASVLGASGLYPPGYTPTLVFDWYILGIIMAALVVSIIISAILPARKAAKLDPIEAIRYRG